MNMHHHPPPPDERSRYAPVNEFIFILLLQVLKSFLDKKDSFYSIHQIGTV